MKLKTALLPSIAAMTIAGENLAFGLGQISVISLQLAVGNQDPDIEQGFIDFDKKLSNFYSGALTTQVVDLAEPIKDGIKSYGVDKMDLVAATGFRQTLTGMYDHIAHHDTGGDFAGKLASTATVMDMLDEHIRMLTPAGDDADRIQAAA